MAKLFVIISLLNYDFKKSTTRNTYLFCMRNLTKITTGVNFTMAKECFICSKKKVAGNQVSHSHIATRRTWGANLQKKSIEVDGKIQNVYICTKCLKTMKNNEN